MNQTLTGNIYIGNEWKTAEISFTERIHHIKKFGPANPNLNYIIPGFTDLHVHGGGGRDFMEAGLTAKTITATHAKFGTTSILATTMTAPFEELENTFLAIKACAENKTKSEARILGVHLEGPFISKDKLGAQPDFIREATLNEIKALHKIFPIKIITLAPELHEHLNIIDDLNALGIVVQIGHSNGTFEDGVLALQRGAKGFTHLFNAMSSFHHRAPGMSGAALAHATFSELIPDLLHVHPGAIKVALRSIPKLYFVTDATAATGMPDGEYKLGSNTVHKCLGGVRLTDGTLAGSALTTHKALLNLKSIGLSLDEISERLSAIPCEYLNITDRGVIKENCFADLVVLKNNLEIKNVYSEGKLI
jgi:N-acetylglucosamine-6-phosphate deacetylase